MVQLYFRKLNAEYNEKYSMKNVLLESQNKVKQIFIKTKMLLD